MGERHLTLSQSSSSDTIEKRISNKKNALAITASAGGGERGIRTLEGVAPLAV